MCTASHGLRVQTDRQGYCLFLLLQNHTHSISSILTGLTASLADLAIRVWYCIQVEEQTRDLDLSQFSSLTVQLVFKLLHFVIHIHCTFIHSPPDYFHILTSVEA